MIKKTIPTISGGTGSTLSFNFKIGLDAHAKDLGWFDSVEPSQPVTPAGTIIVTGTSSSRLSELKKYAVTGSISDRYFTSASPATDGVNVGQSTLGVKYTYYLGGITYVDILTGNTGTTFTYNSLGLNDPANFVNERLIKLEEKENMIENPIIDADVFIIRQEVSVFEPSVRLRGVNKLSEVLTYAGGNYFTIYDNT